MKTPVARVMNATHSIQGTSDVDEAAASVPKSVPIFFHRITHSESLRLWLDFSLGPPRCELLKMVIASWSYSMWSMLDLCASRKCSVSRVDYTGINRYRQLSNLEFQYSPLPRCIRGIVNPIVPCRCHTTNLLQLRYHHRSHVHTFQSLEAYRI